MVTIAGLKMVTLLLAFWAGFAQLTHVDGKSVGWTEADDGPSTSCAASLPDNKAKADLILIQTEAVHSRPEPRKLEDPPLADKVRESAKPAPPNVESKKTASTPVASLDTAQQVQRSQLAHLKRMQLASALAVPKEVAILAEMSADQGQSEAALLSTGSKHRTARTELEHASQGQSKVGTGLGISDIISLCVLVIVIFLALYFVWGGTVAHLKQDPMGALKGTGDRALTEAEAKYQQEQKAAAARGGWFASGPQTQSYASLPSSLPPNMSQFYAPQDSRRKDPVCC